MATERQLLAAVSGQVTFDVALTSGRIGVLVEDRDRAEITIHTEDDDGESADAVRMAALSQRGTILGLAIELGRITGSTFTGGGVNITQTFGAVNTRVVGFDMTSGRRRAGGSQGRAIATSPITILARLPQGSLLRARTVSASVATKGLLRTAEISTTSGAVEVDRVVNPTIETVSKPITIAGLLGDGQLRSTSGSIGVFAEGVCNLQARTVSGSIVVTGGRVRLSASSVSGQVLQS